MSQLPGKADSTSAAAHPKSHSHREVLRYTDEPLEQSNETQHDYSSTSASSEQSMSTPGSDCAPQVHLKLPTDLDPSHASGGLSSDSLHHIEDIPPSDQIYTRLSLRAASPAQLYLEPPQNFLNLEPQWYDFSGEPAPFYAPAPDVPPANSRSFQPPSAYDYNQISLQDSWNVYPNSFLHSNLYSALPYTAASPFQEQMPLLGFSSASAFDYPPHHPHSQYQQYHSQTSWEPSFEEYPPLPQSYPQASPSSRNQGFYQLQPTPTPQLEPYALIPVPGADAPTLVSPLNQAKDEIISEQNPIMSIGPVKNRPPGQNTQAPERTSAGKLLTVSKVRTRRKGPLSSVARDKADAMRITGACWRCRRYRKPCNEAHVCDNCLTSSGFRVWPSDLGCYRGTIVELAAPLMPMAAEREFALLKQLNKRPNWRRIQMEIPDYDYDTGNFWQQIEWRVVGTRIFGNEFRELFHIVQQYQESRSVTNVLVEAACLQLDASSNFYHAFISTNSWYPTPDILETLKVYRVSSEKLWRLYLKTALSGRRRDWFPSFISCVLAICSAVIWTDAAFAMPDTTRAALWADLQQTIIEARARLYEGPMHLNALLTRGTRPWNLQCWDWEEHVKEDGTTVLERSREGMTLADNDPGIYDAIAALGKWLRKYQGVISENGKIWFSNKPFTMDKVQPIGVLSKFFYI